MIRIIIIAVALLSAFTASAQRLSTWEAQVTHLDPNVSPKPAFAGIVEGLQGADIQFVRKTWTFTIVTDEVFEIPWLEGVLNTAGFTLVGLWLEGLDLNADPERDEPAEGTAPTPGTTTEPNNSTSDEGQ